MAWADSPIVLARLQRRWWFDDKSKTSSYETGFELHLTYHSVGEPYMGMAVKPSLALSPAGDRVTVPPACAAYLWDVTQAFSFLNISGFEFWINIIQNPGDNKAVDVVANGVPNLHNDVIQVWSVVDVNRCVTHQSTVS